MAKERRGAGYCAFDPRADRLNYQFEFNLDERDAIRERVETSPAIDISDIRRMALWKLDRVVAVSDETLDQLRTLSQRNPLCVSDDISRRVIEGLVVSPGISYPMASAILKFIRPDVFPIIDVRAYRALTGRKLYFKAYSFELYRDYALKLRDMAEATGVAFPNMDEQLYCFDADRNGKI